MRKTSAAFLLLSFARTPVDVLQFIGLVDAASGYNLRDPFEIEYEVILIWVTFVPLILNPIIYFSFLTDYRYIMNSLNALQNLRGFCVNNTEVNCCFFDL